MPSAYSLLPSTKYFEQILTPSIVFASSTIDGLNSGSYPKQINSSQSQNDFIVDKYGDRKDAKFGDVQNPIKGNKVLVGIADSLHQFIDYLNWPENVYRLAIVGYNKLTTSGLKYDDNGKMTIQKTEFSLRELNRNIEQVRKQAREMEANAKLQEALAENIRRANPDLVSYMKKLSPKKRHALIMLSIQENKAKQFKDQEKESKRILRMISSEDKEVRNQLKL
jgi:predicted HNH restriction endonuclease